jgi:hypothetical protein
LYVPELEEPQPASSKAMAAAPQAPERRTAALDIPVSVAGSAVVIAVSVTGVGALRDPAAGTGATAGA